MTPTRGGGGLRRNGELETGFLWDAFGFAHQPIGGQFDGEVGARRWPVIDLNRGWQQHGAVETVVGQGA